MTAATVKPKTILIVEDERILREALIQQFSSNDFTVFSAVDGQEGLQKALDNHPDVILLDILLPAMDGMTVFKKLRQDAWGRDARVIFLTNVDNAAKVAEGLTAGFNGTYDYLIKANWTLEDIVAKVKTTLQK